LSDHDLAMAAGEQDGVRGQNRDQDQAFVGFRAGQREPDREAVQGSDQVQAQPPEEPGVRGELKTRSVDRGWRTSS
jgi:hypothetical protein